MANVAIIGFGNIGQALKKIIRKEVNVFVWDKDFSKIPLSLRKNLEEIIPQADFVFLCVPSWSIREALLNIKPYLKKKVFIISLAKGIEKKTSKTCFEILEELAPFSNYGILSGPMIAKELKQKKKGAAVIASKNKAVFKKVKEVLSLSDINLEYSSDVKGVALAGVLKNIYSLAFGISDGLKWGSNLKGWLLTQVILEMEMIVRWLGGESKTVFGIAGLGDLVATSFSSFSNHRRTGEIFVKTGKINSKIEGVISLSVLLILLKKRINSLPLLKLLGDVFLKNKNLKKVFDNFLLKNFKK